MKSRIYSLDEVEWLPLREDITNGVMSKPLIPEVFPSATKASLVRIEPGGGFATHKDPYRHVFYFLAGNGEVTVASEVYPVKAGSVVEIEAGDIHGYKNGGTQDMYLLSLNIPSD